ncbi:MAG: hypothetical protein VX111_00900, partial [Planctomycetota bacterium]|nr:hypothetical protein [Planctomycetota bacterium]
RVARTSMPYWIPGSMPLERFRCRGLLYLDEPTRLLGEYRILLTFLFPGCARCSIPTRVWSRLLNWASRF